MIDLSLVLRDLSIVLAIATAVALVFGRLHLSVVAAFLVAGAILGPTGAGLVSESGMVDALAEIGVALLLFTVGLEISLANLGKQLTSHALPWAVFGGLGIWLGLRRGADRSDPRW